MSLNFKSLFASSLLVLVGLSALGQAIDHDEKLKRIADSLDVKRNYELGLTIFRDYLDFIHPIGEINGFDMEVAIADAPEAICKDIETNPNLVYSPNPDIIHYDDQNTSYEYVPEIDYTLVEQRLNALSTQTEFPFRLTETVKTFINYYTRQRRNYTLRLMAKRTLYFPLFEKYLKEYGLPDQLKYLSIVESALEPKALSRAGALGLWQFMLQTGRMMGLSANAFVDERMDPEKATIAACRYLKFLYETFDQNWELALAAYNCGPGTVSRAIRKAGGIKDFWAIYNLLPKETRNYVPIFTAVVYSQTFAEEHNLIQNQPFYPIDSEVIYINQNLNLKDFAKKINVCPEDLAELNPALKRGVIHYSMRNYPLRIPADRMDYFLENRESILENSASPIVRTESVRKVSYIETDKIYHKIKKGESLNMIASRYGVTTAQLKTWNNLSNNMIHAGRSLVIKRKNALDKQEVSENSSVKNVASSTETQKNTNATHHTIQSGESLTLIAKKYGISVAQIKQWNNLASEKIHPNTRLIVNESAAKVAQREQIKENVALKNTTSPSVSKVEQARTNLVEKTIPAKDSETNTTAIKTQTVTKKQHIVKQGETLWSIANHYNVPINTLKQINKIQHNKLKIGQVIILSL
ncbi:LysM peptidoglycan-binding domain-containing protein [Thermoflexibacter ruber]|uniref:LysM domain-containing protein n=1 Tax=Thermoflexibacter ruber TaxID=1003 RepID=A0A1I2A6X1_9BACT|nr:lytic transglycosylase domain-containing protein [Thermoflexibacter ruber]SFE38530.1 LysM domain-containing protein [Thermoflexibacter ruber]